jgi:glutathione synthase/RimK-type ligase-like ATP-grasp enzyme
MSVRVALATCADLPNLDEDDAPLIAALQARGATVTLPRWDGPLQAFARDVVDVTVVRSTWDYTTRRAPFVAWANEVDRVGRLRNGHDVIAWNTDKHYLQQLAQADVPGVPTVFLAAGSAARFVDVVATLPVQHGVVLKPTVGAGSRDTVKLEAHNVDDGQRYFDDVLGREPVMVQPFLPSIAAGERSRVFLDQRVSHARNKQPRAGDFRSQPEFGSLVTRYAPTAHEFDVAAHALSACGHNGLLYARVDLVMGLDGAPIVIELELTEPSLYLGWSDTAADALADAICAEARSR